MTTTDVQKLTDEELEKLRLKIASILGWREDRRSNGNWWINPEGFEYPPNEMPVPDYTRDLNAVHEVEKTLSGEQWSEYASELEYIVRKTGEHLPVWKSINPSRVIDALISHATARQRCEALVLTLEGGR